MTSGIIYLFEDTDSWVGRIARFFHVNSTSSNTDFWRGLPDNEHVFIMFLLLLFWLFCHANLVSFHPMQPIETLKITESWKQSMPSTVQIT